MLRKTTCINEDTGEILKENTAKIKIWDEKRGLLWKAKNFNTKMFHDTKLSDVITNKIELANLVLLSEHIYKQTNSIMVRINKNKVKFADIRDMSKIINLCEKRTISFINKMIKLNIIGKRIDKVGDKKQVKYLLNPLFFFSDKYLSADLYFVFKDTLKSVLKQWQINLFEETNVLVNDLIVDK